MEIKSNLAIVENLWYRKIKRDHISKTEKQDGNYSIFGDFNERMANAKMILDFWAWPTQRCAKYDTFSLKYLCDTYKQLSFKVQETKVRVYVDGF